MTNTEAESRPTRTCDECGSAYFADASAMAALCPECAHHLYGYDPCEHDFIGGRCARCGWDGSRSPFVRGLLARDPTRPHNPPL